MNKCNVRSGKNILYANGNTKVFNSINQAKKESRRLQQGRMGQGLVCDLTWKPVFDQKVWESNVLGKTFSRYSNNTRQYTW